MALAVKFRTFNYCCITLLPSIIQCYCQDDLLKNPTYPYLFWMYSCTRAEHRTNKCLNIIQNTECCTFCRVNRQIIIIKVFTVKPEKVMMINRSNSNFNLHPMLNSTNETNEVDFDVNNQHTLHTAEYFWCRRSEILSLYTSYEQKTKTHLT